MAKAQQKSLHFVENFGLSGAAAIISKTAAAPIERVKLLVQNQDEMIKAGRLDTPYKGVLDCTARTYKAEGFASFWRGKYCSVSSVIYLKKKLTCWNIWQLLNIGVPVLKLILKHAVWSSQKIIKQT